MVGRLVLTTAVTLCLVFAAQAEHLDVYILTGQSNSLGTTSLEGGAPAYEPGADSADAETAFFWSNASTASSNPNNIVLYGDSGGAITTLQMQQGDGGTNPSFWGPEFGMARTLFASGQSNVMVIKASRGGGGNSFWLPATGHMYNHTIAQIDLALAELQNAGDTFDVKGFIYLQGESNNGAEAAAADTRLQTLIDGVQAHVNTNYANAATNMYTVVGEIAASQSNANRILTTDLQQALGANSSTISFIPTRDQPLKSDGIHFGRDAKLEIGRRFADAFNSRTFVENARLIAGYSANEGSVDAIPHPLAQGWSQVGNSAGVTLEEVNDNGTPAWRVFDNSRSSNPGYQQSLDAPDFQAMFDTGWRFRARAKVISVGGLALWSLTQANDPGWEISAESHMNGFQLMRQDGADPDSTADDELEISLWQNQPGGTFNLGAGSADEYHTLELRGEPASHRFDFYIDGQLTLQDLDLRDGAGLAGFDDMIAFNSGSTSGGGLDVYWNEVFLETLQAADFDRDGDVDGNDFLIWQQGFGSMNASHSEGDADLDGDVDGNDFLIWQQDFGGSGNAQALGRANAVPESESIVLASIAGLVFLLWRR